MRRPRASAWRSAAGAGADARVRRGDLGSAGRFGRQTVATTFLNAMIDPDDSGHGIRRRSAVRGGPARGRSAPLLTAAHARRRRRACARRRRRPAAARLASSSYLTKNGHRVAVGDRPQKRGRFLDAGLAFDIIVLDVMMPCEKTASSSLRDLRRKRSQVPILMLTARGDSKDRVRGLEIGVDDYLAKPFEPRELLLRIGSVLRANSGGALRQARGGGRALRPLRVFARAGRVALRRGHRSHHRTRARNAASSLRQPGRERLARSYCRARAAAAQERTVDVLINRLQAQNRRAGSRQPRLFADGAGDRLPA